jgi:hypothetical protein
MRPTQFRHRGAIPALFVSCKCEIAIPIHRPLLRDAVQQAALEPAVRAIQFRRSPDIECPRISLHGVVLDRVDGRFASTRIRKTTPAQRRGARSRHLLAGAPPPALARTRRARHPARAALQQRARGVVVCPLRRLAHRQTEDRARARRGRAAVDRGAGRARSPDLRHRRRRLCSRVCRSGRPQHSSRSARAIHDRGSAIADARRQGRIIGRSNKSFRRACGAENMAGG